LVPKGQFPELPNQPTFIEIKLKGVNSVTKKLADATQRTYYYAWKGGPRLRGKPGSAEFIASYREATAPPPTTPFPERGQSVVYFILVGEAIKIGFSTDLRRRLKEFRCATAEPIHFLVAVAGDRQLESRLSKIRNELFRPDQPLRDFIDLEISKSSSARAPP
jgi:hypothetical protein